MKYIHIRSERVLYISNSSHTDDLPQSWTKFEGITKIDNQQIFDFILIEGIDEKEIITQIPNIIPLFQKNTELHIIGFKKSNCCDFLIELSKYSLVLTSVDIAPLRMVLVQGVDINLDLYRSNLNNKLDFMLLNIIQQANAEVANQPPSLIKLIKIHNFLYSKFLIFKAYPGKKRKLLYSLSLIKKLLVKIAKKIKNKLFKSSKEISKDISLSPQKAQLHKEILDLTQNIKDSNGSRYYPKIKQKIGIISDNILYNAVADCADFIYITPDNYREVAKEIDVFMFIACWRGLDNEWSGIAYFGKEQQQAIKVVNYLSMLGIPTVFWSIEDPPHYENFINVARVCDVIYTTAEEKIPNYKSDCLNDNVFAMPFGVNPLLHNPINMHKYQFNDRVLFAGAWYKIHIARTIDMTMLFDGIINSTKELYFIDRNFYLSDQQHPSHTIPSKYADFVYPSVTHKELQKLQKLFPWCLNLSTVKDSFTMFANRIPELQAQGAAVLSNYSVAINSMYPNVFTITDSKEIDSIFNSFTDEELFKHRTIGIRKVMEHDTYFQKLSEMLSNVGIKTSLPQYSLLVVVEKITDSLQEMFNNQILSERKELIELSNFTEEIKNSYDMIAFWGEDRVYEEFYLQDLAHGFKYTNSSYITKHSFYKNNQLVEGTVHDYVDVIFDKYATLFWSNQFSFEELMSIKDNDHVQNGYAIHPFEYIIDAVPQVEEKKEYKLSVIVPCYNNGDHLWGKCFLSLRRSSMFDDMEILLIDDGSTDNYTPTVINRIARQYTNVKTHFFPRGGSGSASRPRNHGVEMASAEYITYLDPDNEAIFDGYTELYDIITTEDLPMIMGYMKVCGKTSIKDFTIIPNLPQRAVYQGKDLLLNKMHFEPQSIQALVYNKKWLKNLNLSMVEGAFGEDLLFFAELLLNSPNVHCVKMCVHNYYSAVSGSSVNHISKRFFQRFLDLDKALPDHLNKYGVLDEYIKQRFHIFMGWIYQHHLSMVKAEEYDECLEIALEAYLIYKPYLEKIDINTMSNVESVRYIIQFFDSKLQGEYSETKD